MRFGAYLCFLLAAATAARADETLSYALKWPTGISMGRATLTEKQGGTELQFDLDASLPGIPATGAFHSRLNGEHCTAEFSKKYELGFRKSQERTTIADGKAKRETDKGGSSTFNPGECPRDALAFIQFLRAELKAGRKPASQTILFGAQYNVALQYGAGEGDTDKAHVTVKGPASQHSFDILFQRDGARTPLRVEVPLAMGKFVLELVR